LDASLDHLLGRLDELDMILEARMLGVSAADHDRGSTSEAERHEVTQQSHSSLSAEERVRLISQAAYYRAEQRHFAPSNPVDDWRAAEAEIDARLRK
jgi:hypothetical protein